MNTVEILIEKLQHAKDIQKKSNFELALQIYLEIIEAFETEGKHEGYVMDCLSGICQNLANLGRVHEIPDYLEQYKAYCQVHGDNLAKLKMNKFIGFVSGAIEDYETAIYHFEIAISIAEELEDVKISSSLLINLQRIYLDLKKNEEALRCSNHLQQIYKEDHNAFTVMGYCAYLMNYITLLIELGDLKAIPQLLEDLEAGEGFEKIQRVRMYTMFIKGRYFEAMLDVDVAFDYYEKAYLLIVETKEAPYYKQILLHLINIVKTKQDFEKAYFYSELLIQYLNDSERKLLQTKTVELAKQMKFEDMQELIYFDGLTNIHNRRYLEFQGEKWVKEAVDRKESLYCAIFDIDEFKQINDQIGHIAGDEAIKNIAVLLRENIEENMMCARFGGDEFVILARAKGDYGQVFQQLFDALTFKTFLYNDEEIKLRISMGVCSLERVTTKNLNGLIAQADNALYESKQNGKNKLTILK